MTTFAANGTHKSVFVTDQPHAQVTVNGPSNFAEAIQSPEVVTSDRYVCWELTPRGRVQDRLRRLWRQTKESEPDDTQIYNAVDAGISLAYNQEMWFMKARAILGL